MELIELELHIDENEFLLLPTPLASQDYKPIRDLAPSERARVHGKMLTAVIGNQLKEEIGENGELPRRLYLNPEFIETMMGFPKGWTDCNR